MTEAACAWYPPFWKYIVSSCLGTYGAGYLKRRGAPVHILIVYGFLCTRIKWPEKRCLGGLRGNRSFQGNMFLSPLFVGGFCFLINISFLFTTKKFFLLKLVKTINIFWHFNRRHWNLLILCHFGEKKQSKTKKPCMLLLDSLQSTEPKRLEPDIRRFAFVLYFCSSRHHK